MQQPLTGLIAVLRLARIALLEIFSISILVAHLMLKRMQTTLFGWLRSTRRLFKRGADLFASSPLSVLSRTAGYLGDRRTAYMPERWLLILFLWIAIVIIFIAG